MDVGVNGATVLAESLVRREFGVVPTRYHSLNDCHCIVNLRPSPCFSGTRYFWECRETAATECGSPFLFARVACKSSYGPFL